MCACEWLYFTLVSDSRQHIKGLIVYGAKPEFSERTYLDQNAHKNDSHNIHRDSCNNFLFETLAQDSNS